MLKEHWDFSWHWKYKRRNVGRLSKCRKEYNLSKHRENALSVYYDVPWEGAVETW